MLLHFGKRGMCRENNDELYKVWPVQGLFVNKFSTLDTSKKETSIDEGMAA
jgi:hypothetical protein